MHMLRTYSLVLRGRIDGAGALQAVRVRWPVRAGLVKASTQVCAYRGWLRLRCPAAIHPKPVAGVHEGFVPAVPAVAAVAALVGVERVVVALAAGPLGAVTMDGKRVDRPIALLAQAMLAEARPAD